jgi:dienelactone hydrolase
VADERVRITPDWCYPNNVTGVKNNKASPEGRGKVLDVWPFEQILDRGFAVATFYVGDIQPDRPDVREGMRATMTPEAQASEDATATIMWWAWGVHRVVDYLVTNQEIDAKRLAVVGHSRLGKTALLAGALDDRLAVVIPHQSGCGGAGPSRSKNDKAESVKRINTSFPHWFSTSFKAFNDDTAKLPFDQNCLVAMCAPRPVLMTNAEEDQWANPGGQFDVLRAAAPAYELYDLPKPLVAETMPETGRLSSERLGYFIRKGTHAMTPADWKVFLDFGDKWLKTR